MTRQDLENILEEAKERFDRQLGDDGYGAYAGLEIIEEVIDEWYKGKIK